MNNPVETWRKLTTTCFLKQANNQFLEIISGEQTQDSPTVKVKGMKPMTYEAWENSIKDPTAYYKYACVETKTVFKYKWEAFVVYYEYGINFRVKDVKYWSDIMIKSRQDALHLKPRMSSFGKFDSCSLAKKIADAGVIGLYNFNRQNMMNKFL